MPDWPHSGQVHGLRGVSFNLLRRFVDATDHRLKFFFVGRSSENQSVPASLHAELKFCPVDRIKKIGPVIFQTGELSHRPVSSFSRSLACCTRIFGGRLSCFHRPAVSANAIPSGSAEINMGRCSPPKRFWLTQVATLLST